MNKTLISYLLPGLLLASISVSAEQVCKHPPPQATPSDTSQFKICAEIFPPSHKGTQTTLRGWSGWIYHHGEKESHTEQQAWASDLDGFLGTGEKITVELSPGKHTITLTHKPGIINYELKINTSVTINHE